MRIERFLEATNKAIHQAAETGDAHSAMAGLLRDIARQNAAEQAAKVDAARKTLGPVYGRMGGRPRKVSGA